MGRGLLIALEGIDGAGTSTQIPRLAAYVRDHGHPVHATAEPSGHPIGLALRQALAGQPRLSEATLALLFAADRLDHLEREIEPALASNTVVLTDRYLLSSYAYQACQLSLDWIVAINSQARAPDLSFFFRISPETAAKRRQARGGAPEHFDANQRQEQVARRYEEALSMSGLGDIFVVNAEAPVDVVTQQLQKHMDTLLHRERH